MTVEDMAVNRQVRNVMARNWINMQRLDFASTHGTVYMRGRMSFLKSQKVADGKEERDRAGVSPSILNHIDKEIRKIPGVRAVSWQIDGWQRTGIGWVHGGV